MWFHKCHACGCRGAIYSESISGYDGTITLRYCVVCWEAKQKKIKEAKVQRDIDEYKAQLKKLEERREMKALEERLMIARAEEWARLEARHKIDQQYKKLEEMIHRKKLLLEAEQLGIDTTWINTTQSNDQPQEEPEPEGQPESPTMEQKPTSSPLSLTKAITE